MKKKLLIPLMSVGLLACNEDTVYDNTVVPNTNKPTISSNKDIYSDVIGTVYVCAPFPGVVTKIFVKVGQSVKQGDRLCILEAMKMENEISSPIDGTIVEGCVNEGQSVEAGQKLFGISINK